MTVILQENNIDEVMNLINDFARKNIIFRSRVKWEPYVYSQIDTNLISSNLCKKEEYGLSLNFQNDNLSFWDFGSVFEFNEQHKFFTVKNNPWSTKMIDQYPNPTEYYFGYHNPTT